MAKIGIVAMDMDGTLLRGDKTISERTAAALRACEERGVKMVLASGRGFESIRVYAQKIGLHSPLICANGARVEASPDGETLLEDCLPEAASREVCGIMLDSGVYFVCYTRGVNYHANAETARRGQMPGAAPGRFTVRNVLDREALLREGVVRPYKYVAFTEDGDALARLRKSLERAGLPVNISSSWYDNLEIMSENANKGSALRFLAETYGVPREATMAFGDERNDLEMIRYAGWGVAMGNASAEIKETARLIAPDNDADGVAAVLEKTVLEGGAQR